MESEKRPSKKQRELLSFIDGFIKGHGYGPSYREIMRALSYQSVSTVAVHVDNLIAKGQLRKRDRSARSLEVVNVAASHGQVQADKITAEQSKWLIDLINQRFEDAAKNPSTKNIDELYVLVGALHVLGLMEAHVAARAKLSAIDSMRTTA